MTPEQLNKWNWRPSIREGWKVINKGNGVTLYWHTIKNDRLWLHGRWSIVSVPVDQFDNYEQFADICLTLMALKS